MVKILRIARFLRGECTRTLHDPSKNKQAQSRLAIIMIFLVGVGGVFACASACAYAPADKSRTAANRRWLTKCSDFAAALGMRLAKSCIYANHRNFVATRFSNPPAARPKNQTPFGCFIFWWEWVGNFRTTCCSFFYPVKEYVRQILRKPIS